MQCLPVKPKAHVHLYDPNRLKHFPLFLHGFPLASEHSSISGCEMNKGNNVKLDIFLHNKSIICTSLKVLSFFHPFKNWNLSHESTWNLFPHA